MLRRRSRRAAADEEVVHVELPELLPEMTFEQASRLVVEHLHDAVPLGSWSVSRRVDDRLVSLTVEDTTWGTRDGDSQAWSDSLCRRMSAGAVQIAPDTSAVPEYRSAPFAVQREIRAYVGVPIRAADGGVFGTLCGYDAQPQPASLAEHAPELLLLATLLGQILQADQLREVAAEREQELHRRAFHDHLTGLPNRALFLDRLELALRLQRRAAAPMGVVLLDVDDFKGVNDTYGHAAGDDLLVGFGERVAAALRPGDTLARIGGDEFAVLVEDGGDALALAERALATLAEPFALGGEQVGVGATAGVATVAPGATTPGVDAVLARADTALYAAKRLGKGRAALHDPTMVLPAVEDLRLRAPLRRAVESGRVGVHWQPVVDLRTGRAVGFDARARWEHGGRPVAPETFVPVAARSGLLPALTDLVLDRVCAQVATWSGRVGHRRTTGGVRVPAGLVADPGLPALVAAALGRHALAPQQLVLELGVESLVADPPAAVATCAALHELGVLLSLDDFGTGSSALLHLQRVPLDVVKIGPAFTEDLDTDPRTERSLAAVLGMARHLGLGVVVEGVDRPAQADVLRRLGATRAQGRLFAGPGPAEAMAEHLLRDAPAVVARR